MQRMKLHLSGVKLPKLGSIQDRVFRDYQIKEAQLEAAKVEISMMIALTNPTLTEASKLREWSSAVNKSWKKYLGLQMNVDLSEHTEREIEMMAFYQKVVKPSQLKIFTDKKGDARLSGVEQLGIQVPFTETTEPTSKS